MSDASESSMMEIFVTSSINTFATQRRFPKDLTIAGLKQKLELLTGASSATMELHLQDKNKQLISKLTDDTVTLGSYTITNDMCLHVVDSFRQAGEFEDLSKVEKFELSEEEYNKRGESFRAFKDKQKLVGSDEKSTNEQADREKKLKEEEELVKKMKIGDRCEVNVAGQASRRGTVMYLGKIDSKPSFWVGVKNDEPLGKNDGTFKGKRYFECQPNYGSFVKPHDVVIGDFPEKLYDLDEI